MKGLLIVAFCLILGAALVSVGSPIIGFFVILVGLLYLAGKIK